MQYGSITHFQTGVAIPVSGLRSKHSVGIGEYPDLALLAQWANSCQLDLIQILPVNDTGHCASPYSALSAFALNPAYLSLRAIPGLESYAQAWERFGSEHAAGNIDYNSVVRFKNEILTQAWPAIRENSILIQAIDSWIANETWLPTYALYLHFKAKNNQQAWWMWPKSEREATPTKIKQWSKKHIDVLRFHAWIQIHCEEQLASAAKSMSRLGVKLKGDIPILINEDSADAWGEPTLFDMKNRAGAPPDMFCQTGQNWGFPCYNWDAMESQDYSWWKDRLTRASKFYHAFRIDHVLGFFRIWEVPSKHYTGMLGRFVPSEPMSERALQRLGLDTESLKSFLEPTFTIEELHKALAPHNLPLNEYFEVQATGLWRFKKQLSSEKAIRDLGLKIKEEELLLQLFWNRIFLEFDEEQGAFYPYWYWYETPTYKRLSPQTQERIRALIQENASNQEVFWERNGEKLLRMMGGATDMLVCAEDLGVVPRCVAPVLQRLQILSLKIERWTRDWTQNGAPYMLPNQYPRLSVNSPSCHDTSSIRGWWEEDWDKSHYLQAIGWDQSRIPTYLTTELARSVIRRNLAANSLIVLLPIQDWMSLHYDLRTPSPESERINVPGLLSDNNWSWRMNANIEELLDYTVFNNQIRELITERKYRPLDS